MTNKEILQLANSLKELEKELLKKHTIELPGSTKLNRKYKWTKKGMDELVHSLNHTHYKINKYLISKK